MVKSTDYRAVGPGQLCHRLLREVALREFNCAYPPLPWRVLGYRKVPRHHSGERKVDIQALLGVTEEQRTESGAQGLGTASNLGVDSSLSKQR